MRRTLAAMTLGVAGAALALAGCATFSTADTRATEALLVTAGFQVNAVDTPDELADLQTLTPGKIVRRARGGEQYYVYADPSVCKCVYTGNEQQYRQYLTLRQHQEAEQARAADRALNDYSDSGVFGAWDPTPGR